MGYTYFPIFLLFSNRRIKPFFTALSRIAAKTGMVK